MTMISTTKAKCSKCDCREERIIVNKHFFLCNEKNQERLNFKKPEKEKIEVKELKKKYSIKKLSPTKRITCHDGEVVTRVELNKKLHLVYNKIDYEREPVCEGCGSPNSLDHSHIIPRSLRPDLICDPDNIRLHCSQSYNSCHQKWERFIPSEVILMQDFERNIAYVESKDKDLFRKMMAKLEFDLKSS